MNFLNNASQVIPDDGIKEKLKKKQKLTVKLGVDPSAPDIHLGHTIILNKLKQFQDDGHEVIFLIGDYTCLIGDPTGKSKVRPQMTSEQVEENAKTYQHQVFKILDKEKTTIQYNSQWFKDFRFIDFLSLTSKYTIARLLEREDFSKRYKEGSPISVTEFLYPLMQGYDSVALRADVELGGTDQTFNLLVGRELQREYGQEPQVILTMPILEGLDGKKKMSKSLNNYISINDKPEEMFGKIMSIPDDLIVRYFQLLTKTSEKEIEEYQLKMHKGENPRNYKVLLAKKIIEIYHDQESGDLAEQHFKTIFVNKEAPQEMPILKLTSTEMSLLDLVVASKKFTSKGEIRRLIIGGGVQYNNEKIVDPQELIQIKSEDILKIGKRSFYKLYL